MDAKRDRLQKKLEDLLFQAAATAAELQGIDQGSGTPHYDQIELPAHEMGQRFSRMIQDERSREVAAAGLGETTSPVSHNQPDHPFRGTIVFVRFVRPTSSRTRTRSLLPSHPFEYEYEYRFTE